MSPGALGPYLTWGNRTVTGLAWGLGSWMVLEDKGATCHPAAIFLKFCIRKSSCRHCPWEFYGGSTGPVMEGFCVSTVRKDCSHASPQQPGGGVELKVSPALSLLESPRGTHLNYLEVKFSPQDSKR